MIDPTGIQKIISELGTLSYGGIWIVSFFSNMVIPVPEEIVLLGFGYLVGTGTINGFLTILIVISALLINDIILYKLSKKGSRLTDYVYKKFFAKRLEKKGEKWLDMNIGNIIFLSRFLVQLRFIGPFLAGTKGVPLKKFVLYDLLALIIYVPIFVGLGSYFHSRIMLVAQNVNVFKNVVLIVVCGVILYGLVKLVYRFFFNKKSLT